MEFGFELPKHVWGSMVLPRLSLKDYIRFSAVCRSWRSLAVEEEKERELHRLPWLMLSQDKETHTALFYSLQEGKTYKLNFTESASKSFCIGSTQDYLVLADGEAKTTFVYNPFSKITTSLPPQYVPLRFSNEKRNHPYFFRKSVVSVSPSPSNPSRLVVASICSCNNLIAETCSSDDKEWSVFGIERCPSVLTHDFYMPPPRSAEERETIFQENLKWSYIDIKFYKGMLYGLSEMSTLVRFNLDDPNTKPHQLNNMVTMYRPEQEMHFNNGYLVESSWGELLMVFRIRYRIQGSVFRYFTKGFLVFKLDDQSGSGGVVQWVQLKSLGDEIIFLGKNSSISVSAKGIPGGGFKGNCIYFTDDAFNFWAWGNNRVARNILFTDNGVFHLEDGRIDSILPPGFSHSFKSEPIWVMPTKLVVPH